MGVGVFASFSTELIDLLRLLKYAYWAFHILAGILLGGQWRMKWDRLLDSRGLCILQAAVGGRFHVQLFEPPCWSPTLITVGKGCKVRVFPALALVPKLRREHGRLK